MKHTLFILTALLVLFTSCKKEETEEYGTLSFKVGIKMEQMDKSSTLSRNTDRICYQILQNNNVITSGTQANTDANYGNISVDLPIGTYTIVVMANYGDMPTLNTDGTFTYNRVGDGFAGTSSFTISREQRTTLSIGLTRVVSKLNFESTDVMPATVSKYQVIIDSVCATFNVLTGEGLDKLQYISARVNRPSSTTFRSRAFLMTEGQEDEVDLRLLFFNSSGDTVYDRQYGNIPIKRNYQTTLTAAMFHEHGTDPTISIDTIWGGEYHVDL